MRTKLLLGGLAFLSAMAVQAISPEALQKLIQAGEPVTIIDIRAATIYKDGHIPNAINIPSSLVSEKQLPPLGRAVVYDEGLGRESSQAAVAALNRKPGIRAEVLEGGFAAWQQVTLQTTAPMGMEPEKLPLITYQNLKKTPGQDVVLVDLRKKSAGPSRNSLGSTNLAQVLTDLRAEFPNASVTEDPFSMPPSRQKLAGSASPPLIVLIDSGDGSAQETARRLKANGIKRFAILAGGEEIIVRKGQPGLQRVGSSITINKPALPPALRNPNK